MAKDDYYVIAYRILAYLYSCLKKGERVDINYIQSETDEFPIGRGYWEYIMRHLFEDGYIEGVMLVPICGKDAPGVKLTNGVMITPLGIEFLQNNSAMSKAKDFLKTLKETIPGL
ncbi:MAG: YjcQ family protein [Lachnotalea sp.]